MTGSWLIINSFPIRHWGKQILATIRICHIGVSLRTRFLLMLCNEEIDVYNFVKSMLLSLSFLSQSRAFPFFTVLKPKTLASSLMHLTFSPSATLVS